jgi:hypothetical protein
LAFSTCTASDVNVRDRASLKRRGGLMKPRFSRFFRRLAIVLVDFNPVRSHISVMLSRWSTDSNEHLVDRV